MPFARNRLRGHGVAGVGCYQRPPISQLDFTECIVDSRADKSEQAPLGQRLQEIISHPSYRIAYLDADYITREDMRPVRLELELLKPQVMLEEARVVSTVVIFGGTQMAETQDADERVQRADENLSNQPDNADCRREKEIADQVRRNCRFYDECRQFARLVSLHSKKFRDGEFIVKTGGGPGIMEAANRGAYDVDAKSIGLNITLPFEQVPNAYITPGLCFQFNYFAIRKMHFLLRAKALVCFPGGFGTLDELFTTLTLRQTQRMQAIPIILYSKDYWDNVINFQFLADQGVIRDEHLQLFQYANSPEEAWGIIAAYYNVEP